jgi:YfiH family protein
MHSWQWQEQGGISYLTCSLLNPWWHGFMSRSAWPAPPEQFLSEVGVPAATFRAKQVHGNQIFFTPDLQPLSYPFLDTEANPLPEGDGLIAMPGETPASIWVASADCTPVLIGDEGTGQVAALHAGWRGTAAHIVPLALDRLVHQGSRPGDLRVALGPAIAGTVYPVHREVAMQVCQTVCPEKSLTPETLEAEVPPGLLFPDEDPAKIRLDVRQVIVAQLQHWGLSMQQIAVAPYCTYQTPEHFFSYRRTGEKAVQWSGILT